jgi:hypothetical protein
MVFSRAGQAPYLTVQSVIQASPASVTITVTDGQSNLTTQSHLTLILNAFDAAFTSANATVSGSVEGPAVMARGVPSATSVTRSGAVLNQQSPVNWTGRADLTKNPMHGPVLPGWPHGAFAAEITAAGFFGAFGKVGLDPTVNPLPSSGGELRDKSTAVQLAHAACWGAGGGLAAGLAVGSSGLTAGWIGFLAGAFSSACADIVDDIADTTTTVTVDVGLIPNPGDNLPPPQEPIGPDTQTQPDTNYGGDGGGGDASKKKPDDDGPTEQAR